MRRSLLALRLAVPAGTLALLASPALAQTFDDAYLLTGAARPYGARLAGAGGAGLAGAPDIGSVLVNPAALGLYGRSELTVGAGGTAFRGTAENALGGSAGLPATDRAGLDGASVVWRVPTRRGTLAVSAALHRSLTLGRSVSATAQTGQTSLTSSFLPAENGYTVETNGASLSGALTRAAFEAGAFEFYRGEYDAGRYPFYEAVNVGAAGSLVEQAVRLEERGHRTTASFGAGVEVMPGLFLGGAVDLHAGEYRFARTIRESDLGNTNTTADYYVTGADGVVRRGFREVVLDGAVSNRFSGGNGRLGLVYAAPALPLRLGVSVETPMLLRVDESYRTTITTAFDEGSALSSANTDAAIDADQTYRATGPWRVGVGAATAVGALTLRGDVEVEDGRSVFLNNTNHDFATENDRIRRDARSATSVHIGAEYRPGRFALRAGGGYRGDARGADYARTSVSAGGGVAIGPNAWVDAAYRLTRGHELYRPYTAVAGQAQPLVTETPVEHQVTVGMRFGF